MALINLLGLDTSVFRAETQRFEQVLQFIPKVNRPSLKQGRLLASLHGDLDAGLPIG
jgi:hypothetical protein